MTENLADKVVHAVKPKHDNPQFDFNKEMYNLLTAVGEPTEESLKANKERIAKLADYCRSSPLYQRSKERNEEFCKDMTAVDIYLEMIYKLVHAPVKLFADGVAILFIPSIDAKLKEAVT